MVPVERERGREGTICFKLAEVLQLILHAVLLKGEQSTAHVYRHNNAFHSSSLVIQQILLQDTANLTISPSLPPSFTARTVVVRKQCLSISSVINISDRS